MTVVHLRLGYTQSQARRPESRSQETLRRVAVVEAQAPAAAAAQAAAPAAWRPAAPAASNAAHANARRGPVAPRYAQTPPEEESFAALARQTLDAAHDHVPKSCVLPTDDRKVRMCPFVTPCYITGVMKGCYITFPVCYITLSVI
jgi:hypothetical protein